MSDPKALAVKIFNRLFEEKPQSRSMPSVSPEKERRRRLDPLDKALGFGQTRTRFQGAIHLRYNPKPRLVKRNFAKL